MAEGSFWCDSNILILDVVKFAQLSRFTKNHYFVHLKWVDFVLYVCTYITIKLNKYLCMYLNRCEVINYGIKAGKQSKARKWLEKKIVEA